MGAILAAVLSWCAEHPSEVFGIVVVAVGIFKGRAWLPNVLAQQRAKQILAAGHVAFHAVEELARLSPDKLEPAAKVARFLDHIDTQLEAQGLPLLDDAEERATAVLADALHAASKAGAALDPSQASPKA